MTCLFLAALIGWRYSPPSLSAPKKQEFAASIDARQHYSLLNVEDADVGQRVVSRNPDMATAGGPTKVDPRTWRLVRLRSESRWADGTLDVMEVKTLQRPEWLEQHRVQVGRMVPIPLDLVEMGLPEDMEAEVVAIEGCPTIQDGPGQVILTTVNRLSNDVYELTLKDEAGKRETIHPTGMHRMHSGNGDWVAASELKAGDQLSALKGQLTVVGLSHLPGTHRVYNSTIEDQHVYFVGKLGALAHNTGCFAISSGMRTVDLSNPAWRTTVFSAHELVYVVRDATTGQLLKVGQTTAATFIGRFEKYVTAGRRTGRGLFVDVFEVQKGMRGRLEGELRRSLDAQHGLPWDNSGMRLGRPGSGLPSF